MSGYYYIARLNVGSTDTVQKLWGSPIILSAVFVILRQMVEWGGRQWGSRTARAHKLRSPASPASSWPSIAVLAIPTMAGSPTREYRFFRSFSAKVDSGWPLKKAEQFWKKLRERKIAGTSSLLLISSSVELCV